MLFFGAVAPSRWLHHAYAPLRGASAGPNKELTHIIIEVSSW
jgi:hypothetical protein